MTWTWTPIVLRPDELDTAQKAQVLRAVGSVWTDLLLSLESGEEWLQQDLSLTVIGNLAAPYAHPQLSPANVLDLMVGLHGALSAKQRYAQDGVLPDKDMDFLLPLSREERLWELEVEVQRCVFGLLHGVEACRWCTTRAAFPDWSPQSLSSALCRTHAVLSLEVIPGGL